jgi:hypothetical protein
MRAFGAIEFVLVLGLVTGTVVPSAAASFGVVTLEAINRQLAQRAGAGDVAAVRRLSSGEESVIVPLLAERLKLASGEAVDSWRIQRLRKSLAVLEDRDPRREIARDLDSQDSYQHFSAFEDAAEIGGDDMNIALVDPLRDPIPGGHPVGPDGLVSTDEVFPAPRLLAVIALSRSVFDPSARKFSLKRIRFREEDVEVWLGWWDTNKLNYMASELLGLGP